MISQGGSNFPVSIYYPNDRDKEKEKREFREGTLMLEPDRLRVMVKSWSRETGERQDVEEISVRYSSSIQV